jgi:hypothetical protein
VKKSLKKKKLFIKKLTSYYVLFFWCKSFDSFRFSKNYEIKNLVIYLTTVFEIKLCYIYKYLYIISTLKKRRQELPLTRGVVQAKNKKNITETVLVIKALRR